MIYIIYLQLLITICILPAYDLFIINVSKTKTESIKINLKEFILFFHRNKRFSIDFSENNEKNIVICVQLSPFRYV